MLAGLALQAAALLPPREAVGPTPAAYRGRFAAIARGAEWSFPDLLRLWPRSDGERAALVQLLQEGSPREVLLASIAAAGARAGDSLARACLRAACELREEDASLAALLAPAEPPAACLPALAVLVLEPDRPLSVRAAAAGRLLQADCTGAWPVARSILRTGTPLDEDAPWADWPRSGRYELPKRILLLAVDDFLCRHGEAGSGYEPNASWPDQVAQLRALEPRAGRAVAAVVAALRPPADPAFDAAGERLLAAAAAGEERAGRALALLWPRSRELLTGARSSAVAATAACWLERLPR